MLMELDLDVLLKFRGGGGDLLVHGPIKVCTGLVDKFDRLLAQYTSIKMSDIF